MTPEEIKQQRIAYARSWGGDEHFLKKTWDTFRVDDGNKRAVTIIKGIALGRGAPGAFIHGNAGTGKTHLMKALFNFLIDWKISLHETGQYSPLRVYWMNMSYWLDDLRNEVYSVKKIAQRADILFIDDIGASNKTDWVQDQVFQLIDWRAERELQTFATSNLKIGDLAPLYGERVVSRLMSLVVIVPMIGKDKRQEQMQQNFKSVLGRTNLKPVGRKE